MKTMGKDFWWKAKHSVHEAVFEHVKMLETRYANRSKSNLKHLKMYGNINLLGFKSGRFNADLTDNRLTLNVVQSACDTAAAKIAKNKPKPRFLTDDGSFSLQTKAKNLERFVDGVFYRTEFYEKAKSEFLRACLVDTGWLKWYICPTDKEIKCENIFTEAIKFDEDEVIEGNLPSNLHEVRYVAKTTLKELYPKFEAQIESAKSPQHLFMVQATDGDLVQVVESFKPEFIKGSESRHTITIEGATLLDEEWKKAYYPYEDLRLRKNILGFHGRGFAREIAPIQIEINRILRTIQDSMRLCSVPTYWVEEGSEVIEAQMNNEIGRIGTYRGIPPQLMALNSVPPENFIQLQYLYEKAFEVIGISTLSAQSKKPDGLDSGKAIREFSDVESERFALVGQSWEDFVLRCTAKIIDLAKEQNSSGEDWEMMALSEAAVQKIKWKDVDLEESAYVLKLHPVNLLPSTPAGKLAATIEMTTAGLLDPKDARRLLDYPDLASVTSLENARQDDILNTIDHMLQKGEYLPPEPLQDLQLGMELMQASYLKYKRMNVDRNKLELLTRWVSDAFALTQPPEPDPAALPTPPLISDAPVMPENAGPLDPAQLTQAQAIPLPQQ